MNPLPHPSFRSLAFSLVEIVLALGIAGFVAVAILGLAAIATNGTREADLNSRFAQITQRKTSELKSLRLDFSQPILNQIVTPEYFDATGTPLSTPLGKVFTCTLENVTPVTDTIGAPPGGIPNFKLLRLTVASGGTESSSLISLCNFQGIQLASP